MNFTRKENENKEKSEMKKSKKLSKIGGTLYENEVCYSIFKKIYFEDFDDRNFNQNVNIEVDKINKEIFNCINFGENTFDEGARINNIFKEYIDNSLYILKKNEKYQSIKKSLKIFSSQDDSSSNKEKNNENIYIEKKENNLKTKNEKISFKKLEIDLFVKNIFLNSLKNYFTYLKDNNRIFPIYETIDINNFKTFNLLFEMTVKGDDLVPKKLSQIYKYIIFFNYIKKCYETLNKEKMSNNPTLQIFNKNYSFFGFKSPILIILVANTSLENIREIANSTKNLFDNDGNDLIKEIKKELNNINIYFVYYPSCNDENYLKLEKKVTNLTIELQDSKKEITNLTIELQDSKKEIQDLTKDLENSEKKVTNLTIGLQDSKKEIQDLKEKIDNLNKIINSFINKEYN